MAMIIPKPTAASAAATVITIKTNNCPETSRKKLENATKVRFTALSINSMHMNIEITLRLISTPTTPIVNSTAESARYHESCGVIVNFRMPISSHAEMPCFARRRANEPPLQLNESSPLINRRCLFDSATLWKKPDRQEPRRCWPAANRRAAPG